MSVSDTTSSLSMNDILANSSKKTSSSTTGGIASATNSATGGKALGKDAFLQLLVTQLKNQDPLQPMENGEFLAQLAQFSTVGGIEKVNDTLATLGDGMRDFRVATAANLLGVIAALRALGVALPDAVRAAAALGPVPGRMQRLGGATPAGSGPGVLRCPRPAVAEPAGLTLATPARLSSCPWTPN